MQRTEGELCAAAEAGRTRAAEGNNRQDNFSPLKSDGSHFSFREKSWRADFTHQRSYMFFFVSFVINKVAKWLFHFAKKFFC